MKNYSSQAKKVLESIQKGGMRPVERVGRQISLEEVEKTFQFLIKEKPELFGVGGSQRNWLEREAVRLGIDLDYKYGYDEGVGPKGNRE